MEIALVSLDLLLRSWGFLGRSGRAQRLVRQVVRMTAVLLVCPTLSLRRSAGSTRCVKMMDECTQETMGFILSMMNRQARNGVAARPEACHAAAALLREPLRCVGRARAPPEARVRLPKLVMLRFVLTEVLRCQCAASGLRYYGSG